MRKAVVFLGGSREIATTLQRTVPRNVRALARSGIVVPAAARKTSGGTGISHQRISVMGEAGWDALREELAASTDEVALLVVPALLQPRGQHRHQEMLTRLATLADDVVVVSVVAEQLTLMNDGYRNNVASWRTAARLPKFLPRLLLNERYDHEAFLRPWYEQSLVRYVAVPQPDYDAENPLAAVLRAAGSPVEEELAGPSKEASRLGPVGVEANRLLATYLRSQIPDFSSDTPAIVEASRTALAWADRQGWCTNPFWGWTTPAAEEIVERFAAANKRFARAVWGTKWTLPSPVERPTAQAEFLELDPHRVDDIQRYVMTFGARIARQLETGR